MPPESSLLADASAGAPGAPPDVPDVASADTGEQVRVRPTTRPMREPEALSPRLRVRRAVYLMLLTVLVPGSAQLSAGNRRLGRIALRVWLAALAAVLLVAVLGLVGTTLVFHLATSALVLGLVTVALFAAAIAWPLLAVDSWRLGRPALLPRRARLGMTGVLVATMALTSLPLVGAAQRVWAGADLINGLFGASAVSAASNGRYNVLLLGGDAGPDRIGTRPDSMTLASIDADTGRTVLFSLPRNLENIPFPAGSTMAGAMPQGWNCGDACLLNGIYTYGAEHRNLFPGAKDPGAEAMKQAVEGVTGLKVNYYVLIDLAGFRRVIDAMGGITVTVNQRVPIGGGTSKVSGYLEPGTQHLDGYHALWFARSRHGASDYARMERQRCVMNAMVKQLDPATLVSKFTALAAAGRDVMSTDLPAGELATFIDLGLKGKTQKITSVQFVPPLVNPAYPDFSVIRKRVTTAIELAEHDTTTSGQKDGGAANAAPTPKASSKAAPAKAAQPAASASAVPDKGVDIAAACSAG